jgi:hypothetical protein
MLPLKSAILVGAVMLLAGSAHAQIGRIQLNSGAQQENAVRVQSGINLFIPGPTGEGDEAQKLRDKAQHAVYEMAGRECDLLREVLTKDCRLVRHGQYQCQRPAVQSAAAGRAERQRFD